MTFHFRKSSHSNLVEHRVPAGGNIGMTISPMP